MDTDPSQEPAEPDERRRHEQFAELVSADLDTILESFAQVLNAIQSPLTSEPRALGQMMTNGANIVSDAIASTRAGDVRIDERYKLLARTIGESRAESKISPSDSLRAAEALFRVAVSTLARHVAENGNFLPSFIIAVQALNESISSRVREATFAYTGYLLEHIHQEHVHERHRIARDLHDRLGERLSIAFRQLELQEMDISRDADAAESRSALARGAITDGMRELRSIISDLRLDPITSLEKAFTQYIGSADTDVDVQLQVSGDETWAPPAVIDEAFLIIREAIRNALAHGAPSVVLIRISIAPNQLRALVDDDGQGFVMRSGSADPAGTGNGLASMHERAALLGGWLTVASAVGQGTRVDLTVPLPGHRDHSASVRPPSSAPGAP
jgi:signal transduction histidine kinase